MTTQSEAGDIVWPVLVAAHQHTSHRKLWPEDQDPLHSRERSPKEKGRGSSLAKDKHGLPAGADGVLLSPPRARRASRSPQGPSGCCPQALTLLAFATQRLHCRKKHFRARARDLGLEFLGPFL